MKSPFLAICILHLCGRPAASSSTSPLTSPPFSLLFPCSHRGCGVARGVAGHSLSDCGLVHVGALIKVPFLLGSSVQLPIVRKFVGAYCV